MRIAVIGAGNIGRTLGERWKAAGHDVVYGVRSPGDAGTAPVAEAVEGAEVVLLAVPGRAARDVIASLGSALEGKVVVDATNALGEARLNALDALPRSAHAVRAFNTLGWERFAEPLVDGVQADLFYAAVGERAQEVAELLVRDVGLRPVLVGGAEAFDLVDGVTRLWMTLALRQGLGRRVALKVVGER
jgi:8-hydroxy-5-deazaflavin:NADPH oxidoreductase